MNLVHAECYGVSDIGRARQNNEDVFAIVPEKQFFIIADGMGGHRAGEIASSFAVKSMCASILKLPEHAVNPGGKKGTRCASEAKPDQSISGPNEEAIVELWPTKRIDMVKPQQADCHLFTAGVNNVEETCRYLRQAVARANAKVFNESHLHPDYAGMGTTLTCCIIVEDFLIYAHIGDSRLYRYRKHLEQLTEDHSQRQKTARHPGFGRMVITRAIGTQSTILPDIGVISLHSNDLYLLCSDGLSDYVDQKTLASLLSSPISLEEMGRKLIESALEKGGNDNITLLLIKIMP